MKKDLILFDFDGTVIDGSEGIYKSINYALDKMSMPRLPEAILRKFIGPSLFDSFCTHCENDPEKANSFIEFYRERYESIGFTECVLYEGIVDAIKAARKNGKKTVICSSKPLKFVNKITEILEISEFFDGVFAPDFSSHTSEKAYLIEEAITFFNTTKQNSLMIGDTKFDIIAAKKAGIQCVGVRYGFATLGELEEYGADDVVSTTNELAMLLRGLS